MQRAAVKRECCVSRSELRKHILFKVIRVEKRWRKGPASGTQKHKVYNKNEISLCIWRVQTVRVFYAAICKQAIVCNVNKKKQHWRVMLNVGEIMWENCELFHGREVHNNRPAVELNFSVNFADFSLQIVLLWTDQKHSMAISTVQMDQWASFEIAHAPHIIKLRKVSTLRMQQWQSRKSLQIPARDWWN